MSERARELERWLAGGLLAFVVCSGSAAESGLIAALCLPVCARNPSGRRALRRRIRALLPLLVSLGLAYAIGGMTAAASSGNELLARFGVIATRVSAAALLLAWLTHDLRASQLARGLRALRLPLSLIELIMSTRAFGRQLQGTLQAAWAACALRGGLRSWRALRHTIGSVAGVVVLRSIDRSERVAIAQALRGEGCRALLAEDQATQGVRAAGRP
jgi:energy-coupling factor transporter transmembrane protein EcfT